MTSTDGAVWNDETEAGDYLQGIIYGNGTFVAVGESGRIMTSTDGAVWSDETEAGDLFYGISYGN
ncbi:MAG: hypothetical protein GY750_03295 [Lentisphaerae bacterium]|nr:hypothetical protein [Lentisphaerota bacterium]